VLFSVMLPPVDVSTVGSRDCPSVSPV
jgi:hypothetical protein